MARLLALYGTESRDIFALAAPQAGADSLLRAELLFAMREEMPQTLGDLVFRRTGIAAAGLPVPGVLHRCAETMAAECGWSATRMQAEIAMVEQAPSFWQAGCGNSVSCRTKD